MGKLLRLDLTKERDLGLWQRFVESKSDLKVSELAQWRLLFRELYNFGSYNFIYQEDNIVKGAASVYSIRSPFLGNMLVSSPFFSYGGISAESDTIEGLLINELKKIGLKENIDFLEFRLNREIKHGFAANTAFSEFDLDLTDNTDEIWTSSFSSNVRQNLRRSKKSDFRFIVEEEPYNCYNLLSRTIRDLGTPFHGLKFFRLLMKYFGDLVCFPMVYLNGKAVAGCVAIKYRDIISTPYIGSLKKFRNLGANYFLYWNLISKSVEWGLNKFEFGRSPNGSNHSQFKLKWGCKQIPLFYNYLNINPHKQYKNVDSPSKLMKLGSNIWKHTPLIITRSTGKYFFRYVP